MSPFEKCVRFTAQCSSHFHAPEKMQELIVDMSFHLSEYIRYDGYFQSCEIDYMH